MGIIGAIEGYITVLSYPIEPVAMVVPWGSGTVIRTVDCLVSTYRTRTNTLRRLIPRGKPLWVDGTERVGWL